MKIMPLIWLCIALLFGTGWVKNIIKLSECDFEAPYKCEVMYSIGLIPTFGAIIGWLDFGK